MRKAITLEWFIADHSRVAFSLMGSDPTTEVARVILQWIHRNSVREFTARDCFHDLDGVFKNMSEIKPGLIVLMERGYLMDMGTVHTGLTTGAEGRS